MYEAAGAAAQAAAGRTPEPGGTRGADGWCRCIAWAAGRWWACEGGSAAETATSRAAPPRRRPSVVQRLEHPSPAGDRVNDLNCKTMHHTHTAAQQSRGVWGGEDSPSFLFGARVRAAKPLELVPQKYTARDKVPRAPQRKSPADGGLAAIRW